LSTQKLVNISLAKYESFLELCHCQYIRTKGGHRIYARCDLNRSIVVQTHVDPVPEFVIKNALRPLGISKSDFFEILEGTKSVNKSGNSFVLS
jgi:predicted RNA binding protein YcfA (HicA-like mRNA interferase family)